tara:strand:- start:350 stop:655 length:306 start_codon:yes stop_codon:yes gene_type:complete
MKEGICCTECGDGYYDLVPRELKLPSPHGTVEVSVNALRCVCGDELIPSDQLSKITIALLLARVSNVHKTVDAVDASLTDVMECLQQLSDDMNFEVAPQRE